MTRGIISATNIIKGDLPIACLVENLESLDTDLGSELVHWSNNHTNKFVEVNFSVVIIVEAFEKGVQILVLDFYAKVRNCLLKFVGIKRTTLVVVHDSKLAPKSNYTTRAAALETLTETLN